MNTKEEQRALKKAVETGAGKFVELTEDELEQVTGGVTIHADDDAPGTRRGSAQETENRWKTHNGIDIEA